MCLSSGTALQHIQKHFIHSSLTFFPIYFVINQINKLHLCKPLIRAIDSSNLKNDYSPAQKVTYKYYVGRKAMFDSDFKPGNNTTVVQLQ